MTSRDTTPANIWEALRRLLNCNKGQLAKRLGVTPKTLHRWENGEAGANAYSRAADLLQSTLQAAANTDTLAQWRIDWTKIDKIEGRR